MSQLILLFVVMIKNFFCLVGLILFFPMLVVQLNSGKVVAVGPGARDKDGKIIPVSVKEGETVLLPEYGGTEVKLGEKE